VIGAGVAVGGAGVAVGGAGVTVGGAGVTVGGKGVAVGNRVGIGEAMAGALVGATTGAVETGVAEEAAGPAHPASVARSSASKAAQVRFLYILK
jgi:hypothetical protein